MARARRNFYEGGMYHIIQRGNNRSYIFDDQLDKAYFLNLVKETMITHPFDVLYYVIMDNHYHLLLQMKKTPISKIMLRINMRYGKYYNAKYNRTGTIFGDRYSCVSIKDVKQYMTVILYNAYNPVKAKIVKHPEEYRWCAHLEVVSSQRHILNKKKMLEIINKDESKAIEIYTNLLNDKIKGITPEKTEDEIRKRRNEEMKTLLYDLCKCKEKMSAILAGERGSAAIAVKRQFINTLFERGFGAIEIANYLKMSTRGVREYRKHKNAGSVDRVVDTSS